MQPEQIGDLLQFTITTMFEIAAPMLLAGLAVGVLISLFQAATQINEVTLVFIPKMVVVGLAMWFTGPWIFERLSLLIGEITARIGTVGGF